MALFFISAAACDWTRPCGSWYAEYLSLVMVKKERNLKVTESNGTENFPPGQRPV
jgi:hypothetical protein